MIRRWVTKPDTVDGQVDGCVAVASAFWDALDPTLGNVATQALFRRAVHLAREKNPQLASLIVTPAGPDFGPLRDNLRGDDPKVARQVLAALIDELFFVLYSLLGNTLIFVLREVEAELSAKAAPDGEVAAVREPPAEPPVEQWPTKKRRPRARMRRTGNET